MDEIEKRFRATPLRLLGAGALVALAYLVAWSLTQPRPIPWFDGLIPPSPYNWVDPPPELRATNIPPTAGAGAVAFRGGVLEPGFISTDDGQASLSFVSGALPARTGAAEVRFTITPEKTPSSFPRDLKARSNFYRITGRYAPVGESVEATFAQPPLVTLRYGQHRAAASIYARSSEQGEWQRLTSCSLQAATQNVVCRGFSLGWFVVADPAESGTSQPAPSIPALLAIAGVVLLLAAGGAMMLGGMRLRGRRR